MGGGDGGANATQRAAAAAVARMLDHLVDGLLLFDSDWTVAYVNEAGAGILGRSRDELLGTDVTESFPEASVGEIADRCIEAMERQEQATFDVYYAPLEGWFELRLFPAPDGLALVFRDIDERRRADAERTALLDAERAARADAEAARRDAEAARQQLAFLARASTDLARSLREREVLDTLTRLAVAEWVDWCCVYLVSGGSLVLASGRHRDPATDAVLTELITGARDDAAPAAVARVHETGVATVEGDVAARVAERGDDVLERARPLGLGSAVYAPMRTSQGAVGVLALFRGDAPALGGDDVTVAEQLAARAALAVQNARSYEHERSVADALQQAVLPDELPVVPGWQLAARYLPAGGTESVGGDFYDAYMAGDRLVLTLGDVAGHGLRAAAVMGQVRNALRAFTLEHLEPEQVIVRARRLLRTREPDELVTMLFGALDPSAGRLEWATAGHPPPVVVAADGTAHQLDHPGCPPLGAPPLVNPPPSTRVLDIQPGETMVWFTDGLVERRGEDLHDGFARLVAVAPRFDPRQPDAIDAALTELVPGHYRQDDVCVLILRRED